LKASIMFVTYNRLDLTKRMLDSLFKNTYINVMFNQYHKIKRKQL